MNEALNFLKGKMYKLEESGQYVVDLEDAQQALEVLYQTELELPISLMEQELLKIQQASEKITGVDLNSETE